MGSEHWGLWMTAAPSSFSRLLSDHFVQGPLSTLFLFLAQRQCQPSSHTLSLHLFLQPRQAATKA